MTNEHTEEKIPRTAAQKAAAIPISKVETVLIGQPSFFVVSGEQDKKNPEDDLPLQMQITRRAISVKDALIYTYAPNRPLFGG